MVCFVALFAIMHIPMITTLLSAQGSHPLLVSFALCNGEFLCTKIINAECLQC